jgi:hypothetical protein
MEVALCMLRMGNKLGLGEVQSNSTQLPNPKSDDWYLDEGGT